MARNALLLLLSFIFISPIKAQVNESPRAISNIETGLQLNEEIIQFLENRPCEFGMVSDCDRPLPVKDIKYLKELFLKLDAWNNETFDVIIPATDHLGDLPLKLKAGNKFQLIRKKKYLEITLAKDAETSEFLRDVSIASASTLAMYDSVFKLSEVLVRAKKIRSILEYDLGDDSRVLRDLFSHGMSKRYWEMTKNGLKILNESSNQFVVSYFEQYIARSFTASKIEDRNFIFRMKSVIAMRSILSETRFWNALDKVIFQLSKFFGNTVGEVQTRSGKLKKYADQRGWMNGLKQKLRPLDMLLEKTPFRLTDRFIPGHYGHIAFWLGQPEELISYTVIYQGNEIPLLDHPAMFPFLEKFSRGELVLEALRHPGVTMNTLEHFMDIDDLLVLRSSEIQNPGEKILTAVKQFGKPYDFNFDVETEESIVCSELIYVVFDEFKWPLERSLGRYTISPDHVAWKALDGCLEPIILFHDGEEVKANKKGVLDRLLNQRGGIASAFSGSCY